MTAKARVVTPTVEILQDEPGNLAHIVVRDYYPAHGSASH